MIAIRFPDFLARASRIAGLAIVGVSLTAAAAFADNAVVHDPLLPVHELRPASGGWYQPNSNLGNINFDLSDTGVAAGNWSTFKDGKPVWYYFQGRIQYTADAELGASGVIASVESPLASVVDGSGCLTCAYTPQQLVPTGDSFRIEFTSSRTGRFTFKGNTFPIVAWMQGAPLIAERDYSGDWLAVARFDSAQPNMSHTRHREAIAHVRLEPLDGPEQYRFTAASMNPQESDKPSPGARRYRMACVGPEKPCKMLSGGYGHLSIIPGPESMFMMIWIGRNEAGGLLFAEEDDNQGYVIMKENVSLRAYAERDQVSLRYSYSVDPVSAAYEVILHRLPEGQFDGRYWEPLYWDKGF